MDYHRARGEHDKEAIAFFAGKHLFTTFNYCVTKERAAEYGQSPKPKQVKERYACWLNEWIGDRFVPRNIKRIGHWLVLFRELKSSVFEAARQDIEAERDRRTRLRKELTEATQAAEVARLVELICAVPGDVGDMLDCGYAIHESFPEAAFSLYEHGLVCHGMTGYKGSAFHRCANNLLSQCMRSDDLLRRADTALALAVPWGRRNPAIYHNAACIAAKLGQREAVFDYIRRAIECGYDAVKKLKADEAFERFRDDDHFVKLFPTC